MQLQHAHTLNMRIQFMQVHSVRGYASVRVCVCVCV